MDNRSRPSTRFTNAGVRPAAASLLPLFGLLIAAGPLLAGDGADTPPATPEPPQPPEAPQPPETPAAAQAPAARVVVTASRGPRSAFDEPYTIQAVTGETIRERMYRTTPAALRDVPGVLLQKTSHGQGSPYIRGFTGFRNVFLIDGVRLNNSVFREGPNQYWNTVDPFSIAQLEVVKGPGSVQWGSDAIGGVVNALTVEPYRFDAPNAVGGRTFLRFSDAERSFVGRQEISAAVDGRIGVIGGYTYKEFGDLQGGDETDRQPHTGYGEWDADLKIEYELEPDVRLVVAHQRVQQNNVPRTHRTVYAVPFHGTTVGSDLRRDLDQDRELTYIQLHAEDPGADWLDSARFNFSYQRQSETRDRIRGSGARERQGLDVDTFGFWAQFESETSIGRLLYGLDYYHDNVNSFSTREPIQGPVGDDASYDLLGLFIQNTLPVGDSVDVVLGARFNHAAADADKVKDPATGSRIPLDDDWSSLVGSARVLVAMDPRDTIHLFGGISQGFRAPNLSDLSRLDTARTNELEVPSPGLDSESFVSLEFGGKLETADTQLQAAWFYTDIQDMIVRTPTGRVIGSDSEVIKQNVGNGFVHGVELGASHRFLENFTVFGHVAWMEGRVDTFPTSAPVVVSEPIDRMMPLTGLVGLRWDEPNGKLWIEGVCRMADGQDRLSTRDKGDTSRIPPGGTPGYAVFAIRGGWRVCKSTTVQVSLENILEKDYRIHGSGSNEAGRNLIASVEIRY